MTTYTIEDGIPLPETNRGASHHGPRTELTKAISLLEVGQSVLAGGWKEYKSADAYVARHRDRRFAIRKIGGQGWRIWRTE
jgi:hypothetical protein